MINTPIVQQLTDLEAFSLECPPAEEVTRVMVALGFRLTLHLPSKKFGASGLLPAQYHYADEHSTELIYMEGKDPAVKGRPYPWSHKSKWWLYPGRSTYAYNRVVRQLSTVFHLEWREQSDIHEG